METVLFTLHSRGRPNELRAVGDGRQKLGVLPPVWAFWRGLWITLAGMLLLLGVAAALHPLIVSWLWFGLATLAILEGAAIERLELRLRGWREVGLVEARTPEGAEELFTTGRAAWTAP
ncbi:MAG TPA: hypothetical protein VMM55_05755 [Thermohalobaculum sp.]|nr:hypothetical protein [Thermohalobaculum sp.]